MSIYDFMCAELIITYVELHWFDWLQNNCSELEYVFRNIDDFENWVGSLGYELER